MTEIQRDDSESGPRPQVWMWEKKCAEELATFPGIRKLQKGQKPALIFKHKMLYISCSKFSAVAFS